MNQRLQQFRAEFSGSLRLRFGIYALVALAWGYLLIGWQETTDQQATRQESLEQEASRLSAFENSQVWVARSEDANQLLASLSRRFYIGSRSQAQAQLRDFLGGLGAQQKIRIIDLAVQATDLTGSGVASNTADERSAAGLADNSEPQTLRARMIFEFDPASTAALLLAIHNADRKMVIDRLTLRNRSQPTQNPQAEMELRAFLLPT